MPRSHWHLTIDHIIPTAVGVVLVIQLGRIGFAKMGTLSGWPGRIGHAGLTALTFGGTQ